MKRWGKITLTALALCALVLAGILVLSASASAGNVNLMAVNDRVLVDLTADNMPRTVGDVLYVPYTMLSYQATGIDLGVNAMYSTTKRTVLITDGQQGVVFDTRANTAQDMSGNPVSVQAMVRNGTVFVPIDWLCDYFGTITCTRTSTRYGTLVRLTNSAAILSDRSFVSAADNQLADSLKRYLESGGRGEGENPLPSGAGTASEPPSGGELYLALRWGDEGEECLRLAEGRGLRALFLFTPEQLREQDGLVRRLVGAGHTIGLVLEGEDVETCLLQAEEGRGLLAAIARCPALVAGAPGLNREDRGALAQAGFAVWRPTLKGADQPTGAALVQELDPQRVNYVEMDCGGGGARFLRAALDAMEEENCRIYQPTAPELA